ncbi:hypothetical protein [Dyadobacter pollutisoli]|jgi:hypothetical protein|uniref:Uncharacterized protein n=1 Tax=Dyadobacter pollutisoli TaxID=2910158 RepID=A0A9E8NCL3_9BACT|nr:hypothetical protein [Dyadobacter pollutisoli]WAC12838.1 hypothetical protein ON006_02505 [Dyadobacter pollutisoli]
MAGRRGKKAKFKKILIPLLKWISAIVPVCAFIYILYYYKQFDFLKPEAVVQSKTEIIGGADSSSAIPGNDKSTLLGKVKILENEWHSVGGIAIHSLVIENMSDKTIKNLEVEFKYLSDTQSILTSKIITLKTPLPPKKSTKVSGVSVGYVNNAVVGCDIKVVNATI